ncbi:MAG: hypothetical protein AAF446_11055 [Pseudomonadota bacterium]
MKQLVSHVEIGTQGASDETEFLSAVFGWNFTETQHGAGWFDTPGGKIGLHGNNPGFGFVPYFRVADIDTAIHTIRKLGGHAEDVVDEPGWGRFSNCTDRQGNRFGLHQPD